MNNEYLQDEREIKGYVEIEYSDIDNTLPTEAEKTYPSNAPISEFINSENKKISTNYASLEEDYFLLDGSFVLPYKPENETEYYNTNSGYITDETIEVLNDYIPINISSISKLMNGITLYFKDSIPENIQMTITTDTTYTYVRTEDEYAVSGKTYYIYTLGIGYEEFETTPGDYIGGINLYERQIEKESETLNYSITDNIKDIVQIKFDDEETVASINMIFSDFEHLNRRFRLSLIDFGLSDILKDDTLMNFNIIENIGDLNLEFPTNQLTVNLYDEDDIFDINNPKGYADFLNQGLEVKLKPHIGILTEHNGIKYNEDLPIFYLQNWSNNKNQITLNCVDYLEKIKNTKNIDLVGQVQLTENGCDSLDVSLEQTTGAPIKTFRNFVNNQNYLCDYYLDTSNAFEYLQQLMIWLWGYIYIEDKNIILDKRENTTLYDNVLSLENNLLEEPKYTLREKIKSVSITQYVSYYVNDEKQWQEAPIIYLTNSEKAYNNQPEIVELETYHELHVEARNISQDIGIYKKFNASEWCPVVTSPPTNITFYDLGTCNFKTDTYKKEYNSLGKEITIDNKFFRDVAGYPFNSICESICDKINAENKKYNVSINYTGDPNIKPNMIVPIETQYGEKQVKVLKHTLTFNGGLTGTIEGVGD